jgi:hypothetical protein
LFNVTLCLFHAAASRAYQVVLDTQLNSMVRRLFRLLREKCGLRECAAKRVSSSRAWNVARDATEGKKPPPE